MGKIKPLLSFREKKVSKEKLGLKSRFLLVLFFHVKEKYGLKEI